MITAIFIFFPIKWEMVRIAAGVAFQQDKFKYIADAIRPYSSFFRGGDVQCRIADEIRSCNLFPLPGPPLRERGSSFLV